MNFVTCSVCGQHFLALATDTSVTHISVSVHEWADPQPEGRES